MTFQSINPATEAVIASYDEFTQEQLDHALEGAASTFQRWRRTSLEERSRDSAERIKALMFTFEDLGKLDPGSIQTLLRHVEKDKLALALKGATDSLRDVFFSNMSERAGKILREDMESLGPVRLKDVDEAQMRMVNTAKDLANKGEIMIASKQGEDELIY